MSYEVKVSTIECSCLDLSLLLESLSVATAIEEDVENLTRTEPGRSRRKIRKPKYKQKEGCMQIYSDRTSNVTKQISYSVRPLAARNAFSLMKIIGEFMQLPAMPYDVTAVGSRTAGVRAVATWGESG
jgi:hypothetical protein